jgi:hypothetical protein
MIVHVRRRDMRKDDPGDFGQRVNYRSCVADVGKLHDLTGIRCPGSEEHFSHEVIDYYAGSLC